MRIDILAISLFVIYIFLSVFLRSYVKIYLPLILLGYLMKRYGFADLEPIGCISAHVIGFLLSFNMAKFFNFQFFKYVSLNVFLYGFIEKVFLGFLFFLMLLLFIPLEITPIHFIFFITIMSFVYSKLFLSKENVLNYYTINNIFVFFLLFLLYFFFREPLSKSGVNKFFFIVFYILFLLLMARLRIESTSQIISLLIMFIGLSIIFAFITGVSILLLGFLSSVLLEFFSPFKKEVLNSFIEDKYKYFSIIISFFAGYFLELSYNLLIITVIYIILRTLLQGFYSYLRMAKIRSLRDLVFSSLPFLIQGEELLIFSVVYSLDFNFKSSLSFVVGCVIVDEFLLNYFYHYLKGRSIK